MLDDDIQYLGSRIKLRDPPRYLQRTVSGVALHIEKSDGNEAYVLTFNRDKSSTILVGRRPGNENESRTLDQENGRAMFRCAVVSRRHAKIVFTDSGNVYLIDLGSHHGTHIRKPGETSSRMLEHEIPTPLSDGDIITFGKTVGRSEEMVRPIVARVHLVYNGPSTSTIKPLVVPDGSPNRSGRYGLHSPSSSSSDEAYNGQSDAYSDIEEIPPPAPVAPASESQAESSSKSDSHLGRAFEVLKRLLPPTIPPVPATHLQRDPSPRLEEQSPINSESSSSSVAPSDLPPLWALSANRPSPFPLLPRYPSISSVDLPDGFFDLPPINPVNIFDDGELSRSESPMDLASPSPPPPEQDPCIIGAWADFSSPSSSESEPIATPPDNEVPVVVNETAEAPAATDTTTAVQHEENHEAEAPAVANEDAPTSSSSAVTLDKGKQKEETPFVDPSLFVTRLEYEELKTNYSDLQGVIDVLQAQRRKYKYKFNANVHTVTDKFHELEEKMNGMAAQYAQFMDQFDGAISGDVPDMRARIYDLVDENDVHQTSIDDLRRRIAVCEEKDDMGEETDDWEKERMQEEKERAQKYLDTLKGLIDEMKTLRATTEREIEAELATLRQLRESIVRESVPSSPTKRKRTLDDEGDRYSDTVDHTTTITTHVCDEDSMPIENDSVMSSPEKQFSVQDQPEYDIGFHLHRDRPSPRKRARRIVSVAAQTATAVTMGAVAAWVALAFS